MIHFWRECFVSRMLFSSLFILFFIFFFLLVYCVAVDSTLSSPYLFAVAAVAATVAGGVVACISAKHSSFNNDTPTNSMSQVI